MKLPVPEVKYLLRQAFCRETSFTPDKWTPENPSYGHCAVAVLVAQDVLGGEIRRGSLPKEWADKFGYQSHYWNVLPVLRTLGAYNSFDCTRDQFPEDFPYDAFVLGEISDLGDKSDKRDYLLSNPETEKRYEMLKECFRKALHSNPLFLDEKFQRCWELAFSENAQCKKMRFACLVYDGGRLICGEVNRNMAIQFGKPRFCSFDGPSPRRSGLWPREGGPECIRLGIQSRTDSTIGDCGHAPVWSLARVFELGYKPSDLLKLDFYETGFRPDGSPWYHNDPNYSCIYCQNVFAIFGLDKIWVPYNNQWVPFWTKDSFYISGEYATGKKKI